MVAGWLPGSVMTSPPGSPTAKPSAASATWRSRRRSYDASDRPVFTIFKEQRIEVPLDEGLAQPDRGGRLRRRSAVLRSQRRRRDPRWRAPCSATCKRDGARRAAARSRSSSPARASSVATRPYRRKLKEVILATLHREPVYETGNPRAVPEQGLLRRRSLRRRSGRARILRQERQRAGRRRSGPSCRTDPVAIELRTDGQPGSRGEPAQRRAADDGVVGRDRPGDRRSREEGAGQAGQRARDQGDLRPLLQGAGPPRAGRSVRLAARLPGRPSRPHDDERRDAAGGRVDPGRGSRRTSRSGAATSTRREARAVDRAEGVRPGLPAGRDGGDGSRHRTSPGDGRRPQFRARAASTARFRRNASPARHSSRSSMPRRSSRDIRPRRSSRG